MDTLRNRRVEDRIRATQQAVRAGAQDFLDVQERVIGEGLNDLGQRLQRAADAASQTSQGQRQQQALDRMREALTGNRAARV